MSRQRLDNGEDKKAGSAFTVAQARMRNRPWDKRHQSEIHSYRGIPQELHDRIVEIAKENHISPGELMRFLAEHGLQALERGDIRVNPVPVPGKMTLFPEDKS